MDKKVAIDPLKGRRDPALSECGILQINPAETAHAMKAAERLGGKRYKIFHGQLRQTQWQQGKKPFFVAGPAVGAPMAVMTLEKLIVLGAKKVIVYGWCGALNPALKIGHVLLPSWGVSEEGTSKHYPLAKPSGSDSQMRSRMKELLKRHDLAVHEGPVWTTDAPYRETREKIEAFKEQGIFGVDMEFTALSTVAAFRGISLCAVFIVSDELWGSKWRKGFSTKSFRSRSNMIMQVLFDYCQL